MKGFKRQIYMQKSRRKENTNNQNFVVHSRGCELNNLRK